MTDQWNGWLPNGGLLDGKVAVVLGAGGVGIGGKTTQILGAAGANVVAIDVTLEGAEAAAAVVTSAGGTAHALQANVLEKASIEEAFAEVVKLTGGFDVLVNVAGGMHAYASWAPITETADEAWDGIMGINLQYVFWSCRSAAPIIAARGGGAIVNIGTVAATSGSPGQAAYGAAKAAVIQLTKTLAVELGPMGIRANAVSPGVTMNSVTRRAVGEESLEPWAQVTPLRKLGRAEDLARAILFFASPMSDQITGQMISIDGGVSSNFPYPGLGRS